MSGSVRVLLIIFLSAGPASHTAALSRLNQYDDYIDGKLKLTGKSDFEIEEAPLREPVEFMIDELIKDSRVKHPALPTESPKTWTLKPPKETTTSHDASAYLNLAANTVTATTAGFGPSCRTHLPDWLKLWCVLISLCTVILLIGLATMVHYLRLQQRQQSVSFVEVPRDFYGEHLLDRSRIMVY